MSSPNLRQIPRDKLVAVFKNMELVLLFEEIIRTLNDTLPGDTTAVEQALADHIADTTDAHQASAIGATPAGSRASNTVQGQLGELDSSKLAESLVSTFMLTLLDDVDAATARGTLGLGSMATQAASSVNISGGTVRLGSGALGYGAGNGGTVTQATDKTTGVTLNKLSGDITLNAAALAAGTVASFTLTNSNIGVDDLVHAAHNSAGTNGAYAVTAQVLSAGSCLISVRNLTTGSLSEAIVIRFAVFKSATT
jgi:hypothetical protein